MTDRIRLDDMTSDQLDALYDERDAALERLDFLDRSTMPDMRRRTADDAATIKRWRKRAEQAEAAIERVLSPAGIRAAAAAMGDETLNLLGRDLGTIHVETIAEAGLRAALDQPQQPTTTNCVHPEGYEDECPCPASCICCQPTTTEAS